MLHNTKLSWITRTRLLHAFWVIVAIALFGFIHSLNYGFNISADWSKNQRNTLSQSSVDLLKQLSEPLHIKAYYDQRTDLRTQIQTIIARYQRIRPDIKLEFVSTELPREEIAQLGFTHLGQTVLEYEDRREVISRLDEKSISQAIFKLLRTSSPWLVMLQGHGERDPYDEGVHGYSKWKNLLQTSGFNVQTLDLLRNPVIPDNVSLLFIIGANSEFLPGELRLIEDYIARGGNLLLALDPDTHTGLNKVAATVGIDLVPGVIIDANTQLRGILGIKHPAVIPVVEYQKHAISSNLKHQTLFPFAQGLKFQSLDDWQGDTVFSSLPRSWSETGSILDKELALDEQQGDTQGPLPLAIALHRVHNGKNQRIMVVGDSDFIANGYFDQGENATLALNMANWLNEDEQLIAIRPPLASDQITELTDQFVIILAILFLLALPIGLLATGIGIHWYRIRQ